jgi:ribosomal protein S27E
MNRPNYKWFSYNLNIACEKCGDRTIFQTTHEKVACKSCGHPASYNWEYVLSYVTLEDIKKHDNGSVNLMGEIEARSKYELVEAINCYHCKSALEVSPENDLVNHNCTHCHQPVEFENINGMDEFVIYSYKTDPNASTSPAMVAVRCVSCGAPLEADPTQANYHCKFCSTENILPLSLRYKVVVNDIYVGIKRNFFPKKLLFSKDPVEVLKALKQNGIGSLKDEELNQILQNHLYYTAIYFEIIGNEYNPPKEIEEKIYHICKNEQHIKIIGHKLGKSIEEIDKRLLEVNPNYQPANKTALNKQPGHIENKKQSPPQKDGFFKRLFG